MTQSNESIRPHQVSFHIIKDVYQEVRETVHAQMRGAVLNMVDTLFNEELEQLCGPKFSRKRNTFCHRGGSDPGRILWHGQQISVRKPRMKKDGQEVELRTYTALQHYDLLCDSVMKHIIAGVSTRDYDGLMEEVSGGLGLSKSSVSRAFVKGSKQALEDLNGRSLQDYHFVSIMIDGIDFGGRTVIAAIGITESKKEDEQGEKIVLGLREGSTENTGVCKDLLESLIERGLDPHCPYLFVIDGGKALRKAIKKVFGEKSPVQRCTRHKERNVIEYLDHGYQLEFRRRWKKLHGYAKYDEATKEYDRLHQWLSSINYSAANSLAESKMETLTVLKLGVPNLLRKTLLSTNPIESMFSITEDRTDQVKNWKSATDQVSRWAAVALSEAEKRVKKVKGYRQIPILRAQLEKLMVEKEIQVA